MYLADALSRAFPLEIVHEQFEADIDSERFVHLMSTESYVTDRKLQAIRSEVSTDQTVILLQRQIQTGWPERKSLVPTDIRAYHQDRHELTTEDGLLIYKAHNILIPPKLRRDTLNKLHQLHQGMAKTKRLARESIYWPGMNAEFDDVVSTCETCQTNSNANQRENLQSHPVPSRPWQQIGTDLFEWKGKLHLIIVDYYSRYPEVAELRDTKARTVISKTKSIFSRHGIPDNVISDNGPQYSSDKYRQFSQDYDFQHTTISPRYPQSGGLHEKNRSKLLNIS